MKEQMIYLDHAATTKTRNEVIEAMLPYFNIHYGNASSIYSFAAESRKALSYARTAIAQGINALPEEIYFTASGTEADNFAIIGRARKALRDSKGKKNKIITSATEHHAVLHTCEYLEKEGFRVEYLPVDEFGTVDISELEKRIDDDTSLVSIMYANNETGTIQPIDRIAQAAKDHKVPFHTDAVQAAGAIPIDVRAHDITMMSMSAHKFYGPKGIGVLYIKKGTGIDPYIHGGAQERRKRAGTENVAFAVGMAQAFSIAVSKQETESKRLTKLRDYAIGRILAEIDEVKLNGHPKMRLPNNINCSFKYIEGEGLLLMLDFNGIMASSGSACTSGSLDPSHVLLAMGISHETAHGSLRLSMGEETTKEDLDFTIDKLKVIVKKLRDMSPLYDSKKGRG